VIDESVAEQLTGGRGGRSNVVADLVEQQMRSEQEAERKSKRTPHEEQRVSRRLNISFPTVEWKDTVLEMADRWGMRTSDFITFCIAFTMEAVDSGELRRPRKSGPIEYHHRVGEALDLPWSPVEGPKNER
jgi:hypothetical protein